MRNPFDFSDNPAGQQTIKIAPAEIEMFSFKMGHLFKSEAKLHLIAIAMI